MRKIFFILIITIISTHTYAQNARNARQERRRAQVNEMIKQQEEGVIAYKKSFAFGAKLINDGYGVFFELGRAKSVKKGLLYQLEISERKDRKEEKQSFYTNTVPYIYGKENFVYPVKLGVQQQVLLGNKSNKNGVAITGNYGGGIAISFLRPYYVQIQDGNGYRYVKYNSADSVAFLTHQIYGGPGFGRGWNELSITPGLYAKAAVRFDYGSFNEIISAIEVGVTGEYYSKKIPQLAFNKEKEFFFGGYVAVIFGKRK
ncbi:MAG TPA: hypothetical protein VLI68_06970 [Hanamia sp.]|jgi:hypothetical protein|nr:hypothetical protein [Hanamia sp.]